MPAPRERTPLTDNNRHLPETVVGLAKWTALMFIRWRELPYHKLDELIAEAMYGAVLAASDYQPKLGRYPSFAKYQMFERLDLWWKRERRYHSRHKLQGIADTQVRQSESSLCSFDWFMIRSLLTPREWETVEYVLSGGRLKDLSDRDGQTRAASSARYCRALNRLRKSPMVMEITEV